MRILETMAVIAVAALPIADCTAASPLSIRCYDADTRAPLECRKELTPMEPVPDWEARHPGRLAPPVQLDLALDGYLPRTIELSASLLDRQGTVKFAMVKVLPAGQVATLGSIAKFEHFNRQKEFDRALSILEFIDAHRGSAPGIGTFHARHMHARHVAHFKACTILMYASCEEARSATEELSNDIADRARVYANAGVSAKGLQKYIDDASVAEFRQLYARAAWFKRMKEYVAARTMYQQARVMLAEFTSAMRKHAQMTDQQLGEDIALMDTREGTQAAQNTPASTPPEPRPQPGDDGTTENVESPVEAIMSGA